MTDKTKFDLTEEERRLKLYTSIVPNARQKIVQEMGFYAFVHFTVNTFTGKEWGSGKEDISIFNPTETDCGQWCRAIRAAGMKGVVLTAKHHDGFCLWRTKTTEHSIKNTPYKGGKGDIVAELQGACKEYGLRLGLYLSPWDRNAPSYGTEAYNDFYIAQLTELMTDYGEIFMLWLDGACGAEKDGKPVQKYDFERIYKTALSYQPNIVLANCAPDVRWIGNESGRTRSSEWSVVPVEGSEVLSESQKTDDLKGLKKKRVDEFVEDLGSREVLARYGEFKWYPAEADVSIRKGWFHHKSQNFSVKSVGALMKLYDRTVGNNSLLLLNIPPNKKGLLDKKDVKRLEGLGARIQKDRSDRIELTSLRYDGGERTLTVSFKKTKVRALLIRENTDYSQRVEEWSLYAVTDSGTQKIFDGTIIGMNRLARFPAVETDTLILKITRCRNEPYLLGAAVIGVSDKLK
ncbi:MAG: alpha-L-fucosidase [Clostridiales bacterium]|jgi:alpha-L-fucosidase|nr:alpha-L-fucosidase [Clostridiales bacterium]